MRPPLDTNGGRPTSGAELSIARQLVEKSGVLPVLSPHIDAPTGRTRHLSLVGLLVAFQLNALQRHHKAHLVEAARVLNAFTPQQRESLGIGRWDPEETYPRVERLYLKLCAVLDARVAGVDATWFMNRFARAAVPKRYVVSRSVAVDGTDVETWGVLHGRVATVELDGEAAETQLMESTDDSRPMPRAAPAKTAKIFGTGPDGRKIYTKDPDARAGHRSATGDRSAGPFVGYELHLGVQTRDVRWTNAVDRTTLGPEVPGVIITAKLASAGTHRAKAFVETLLGAKSSGCQDIADVVWDPGYSLCDPLTTTYQLARAGIAQTIQLVTHQRGIRPFAGDALLLDGQLYSKYLPAELRDLRSPPRNRTRPSRQAYEARFNQRARWRFVRHAGPDAEGVTRWRCPFCAGLLRSRNVPKTMRRSRSAPLVGLPDGVQSCCSGILSAPPSELPLVQRIPFGTTAWRTSMDRRQMVESVNAALKGGYTDLARGFFRVFGQVKISVLFAFTLAAFNVDRIRSFEAKRAEAAAVPRRRAKRRLGTLGVLLASSPSAPEPRSTSPP